MTQKKLQKQSIYADYDEDGDGIVSDAELSHIKEIKETETKLRKNLAQLRMARYTLIFMGCYAIFLASPWCSDEKLKGLAAVTDLIFLSGAGIVGTFMGTSAWLTKNGKQMAKKDPKTGTGKKPKGSGRRLYTDENPKDTVRIKFATPADARATVAKVRRINKPYARKIQILTVMEQRAKVMKKAEVVRIAKKAKESLKKARKT